MSSTAELKPTAEYAVDLIRTYSGLNNASRLCELEQDLEDKSSDLWFSMKEGFERDLQELLAQVRTHLPSLMRELLWVHNWMARMWDQQVGHTMGLAQVIFDGEDTPLHQAARQLVIAAHRAEFDFRGEGPLNHVEALLNVAEAGTKKSQVTLCLALAELGGEIANARSLERDGRQWFFPTQVRSDVLSLNPWRRRTNLPDGKPPF